MTSRYELPPGASLRVVTTSGDVTVIAEDRSDVEASEHAEVHVHGATAARHEQPHHRRRRPRALRILRRLTRGAAHIRREHGPALEIRAGRGGSRDLEIRCPADTTISLGTVSGDVTLKGQFGDTSVATVSGDISVDRAAALDIRSVSGTLEVRGCSGPCRLHTKSGDIEARAAGPAEVGTISGDVELGTDGTETVKVRTVSGQTTVTVPPGRSPQTKLRSISGEIGCECPQGTDFLLQVDSVSGDIEVEPA